MSKAAFERVEGYQGFVTRLHHGVCDAEAGYQALQRIVIDRLEVHADNRGIVSITMKRL